VRDSALETSAHAGLGIGRLREAIRQEIVQLSPERSPGWMTADRCGQSLRAAAQALARAAELARTRGGEELIGSELRVALGELSGVVGAVYTDDILDRIFSRFCIGK
jgi:tRNA modification GTPase